MKSRATRLLALAGLAVLATPAAPLERLTVERLSDGGLSGPVPSELAWTPDGKRLT